MSYFRNPYTNETPARELEAAEKAEEERRATRVFAVFFCYADGDALNSFHLEKLFKSREAAEKYISAIQVIFNKHLLYDLSSREEAMSYFTHMSFSDEGNGYIIEELQVLE